MKWLYFTPLEQSFDINNIASIGDDVMMLINGLCLLSIQPSKIMDTPELVHELQIDLKKSLINNLSFLRKMVLSFS